MPQFDYSKETKEDLIRYIEKIDFILMFETLAGSFLHNAGERYSMEQKIEMLKMAKIELKQYREARQKTCCIPTKKVSEPLRSWSLWQKLRYLRHSMRCVGW